MESLAIFLEFHNNPGILYIFCFKEGIFQHVPGGCAPSVKRSNQMNPVNSYTCGSSIGMILHSLVDNITISKWIKFHRGLRKTDQIAADNTGAYSNR